MIRKIALFIFIGVVVGCVSIENGENTMINSILELTGVEASPVYLPRVDDIGGKGAWQGGAEEIQYKVSSSASAYKTTSSDADPVGLQGSVYWYDTGTEANDEAVYYDASNTYAKWTSTTHGVVFTLIADAGNESVSDYFKYQEYPDTVTVVGTGTDRDGVYTYLQMVHGRPKYGTEPRQVYWGGATWWYIGGGSPTYRVASTSFIPPETGWVLLWGSGDPSPTLTYTVPTDQYVGGGTWSGTITLSVDVTGDVWMVTGSALQLVDDSGTWPPASFGGGISTDLGQVITLNLQDGVGENVLYSFDGTYGTFPTITQYAHIFAGWFTAQEGTGTKAYSDDPLIVPNDDDTLYAKWVSNVSGRVSSGKSMLSNFAINIGTDLFSASIASRKIRSESVQVVLPIPAGALDEA